MKERAQRVATMMGIDHLMDRKPGQLSGGQQQRVALGRALTKEPDLLLFDEPLSNLDARLRLSMRGEIKRLQLDLGITSIYVTHDQVEAMTMADRVAVMHAGHLQAYCPPSELYDQPTQPVHRQLCRQSADELCHRRGRRRERELSCPARWP